MKPKTAIFLVALGFLAVSALVIALKLFNYDGQAEAGCTLSRRAVEAQLTSPATAKWVECNTTTTLGVQTVIVTIDLQNSLGAFVRSHWRTVVLGDRVESVTQIR